MGIGYREIIPLINTLNKLDGKDDISLCELGNNYLKGDQFKRVRLFDDHPGNLRSFLKLQDKYPQVSFNAFLVKGDKVKRYNA